MANVRYASGGTADISSSFAFAPIARASDELSVASWGGPISIDTALPGDSLSRSLSSGIVASTTHLRKRARVRPDPNSQTGFGNSNSAGLLLSGNIESFPTGATGLDLRPLLEENPIARFYSDSNQPWAPHGLSDPVPNAPTGRNSISLSQCTSFNFNAGPKSDLGAHTSTQDSGYGTGIVDSRSCGGGEGFDPSEQFPTLSNSYDPIQSFPNMSSTFQQPLPAQEGAESQQSDSVPRVNGGPPPCQICGVQSKCPSDYKKHMLKHNKPFRCDQPGCSRPQGFITVNDLNRHLKSVHKLKVDCKTKSYKCASAKCRNPDKEWPRLDNFKQHIIRMHPNEDIPDLIARSELKEPSLVIDPTAAEIAASHYRNEQASHDPADLLLSNTPRTFTSSGWNAIQPAQNSGNRLAPLKNISPAYAMNDSLKPRSSHPIDLPPPFHDSRRLSTPSTAGGRPSPLSPGISPLADAPVTNATAPQRTSPSWADVTGVNTSRNDLQSAPGFIHGQRNTLQSLTEMIASQIKNANGGASIEDTVYRAVTQVLGTTHLEPQHQQQSGPDYYPQTYGTPQHAEVDQSAGGHADGGEDGLNDEEVMRGLQALAARLKKQTRQKKHISSSRACPVCKKILPRACDMNKHMKRHTRPFGCTFYKCNKLFGSKNDWKRHESSQHYQSLMFRCPVAEPSKKYGVCARIFYHQVAFEDHLRSDHKVADNGLVGEHIREGRIGKGYQGRFWCGFCKKIIPLEKQGVDGWDERFNHIDDHYKKGSKVDHWVVPETNQTKEEMLAEAEKLKADRSYGDDDDDGYVPSSSSSSSSADEIPNATSTANGDSQNSPADNNNPLKRKIPHDEAENGGNSTTAAVKEWMVYCCQCNLGPFAASLYSGCGHIAPECNHVFCPNCERRRWKKGASAHAIDLDIARHV